MPKSNKERQSRARRRRRRGRAGRAIAFAAVVAGVLFLAGFLLRPALFPAPLAPLAGNVVEVAADMSGFDLPTIRLKAGVPVTLRLRSLDNSFHSDGGGQHQWAVDELGLNVIAQPLSTSSITFTPDRPGTYTFYCDICCGGRANPAMQGTLIVES